MSELSPIIKVAKEILAENRKEMHVYDIAKVAMSKNKNLGMSEPDFVKKISAAMAANLKTQTPIFSKPLNKQGAPRKGIYKLRRGATKPVIAIKPIPPAINTLFLGKAGEYAVASELLFWGFNISIMAVDHGIDLVAEKGGKFSHIQVKTSVSSGNDRPFGFCVSQSSFNNCHALSPWYVFAMRQGLNTDYAVIPSSHLLNLRNSKIITGKDLSIQITRDDKGRQYKLNGQDINMYINNFGLI